MCGFVVVKAKNPISKEFKNKFVNSLVSMSNRGNVKPNILDSDHLLNQKDYSFLFGHVTLPIASLKYNDYVQPVRMVDSYPFVFTGEIFNFKEFGPYKNDTQMMANLFEQGADLYASHSFDGFWSYAGINSADQLIAVNDYLAQKPLYYRTDLNAVASDINSLSLLGPTSVDTLYFSNIKKWGYDMTGNTPYQEIKQLPPGHLYRDGQIERYWNWDLINIKEVKDSKNYNEVKAALMHYLVCATRNRLQGQRDIAILLSGGLDSSIVRYLITKTLGSEQVKSFHVENNEHKYALMIDPECEEIKLETVTDIEAITAHQVPVDLGSVKPQLALAKALKQEGYNVVMTGDGADELFGGYNRAQEYDSQQSDVFCELPYYHNPRLDRIMMSQTIELRTPFLAPKVVKAALSLPLPMIKGKQILKDMFSDMLPEEIIKRKKVPLKTSEIKRDLLNNTQNNIETFLKGTNHE